MAEEKEEQDEAPETVEKKTFEAVEATSTEPAPQKESTSPPHPEPDDGAGLSDLVKDLKVATLADDKLGDAAAPEGSTPEKAPKKWLGVW